MTCDVGTIMGVVGGNVTAGAGGNEEATAGAAPATTSNGSNQVAVSSCVSVIEMALLLYLGEYTHARHLWRRYRHLAGSATGAAAGIGSKGGGEGAGEATPVEDTNHQEDLEYTQLELLWNAARYCYLWSTGGIYSLKSGVGVAGDAANNLDGSAIDTSGMQMEEANNDGDAASLPFSAIALKALQTCHASQMEPLTTYSAELIEVFRDKVNEEMHRSFGRIKLEEYCLRMNFVPNDGEGAKDNIADTYGWVEDISTSDAATDGADHSGKRSVYLVPDPEWELCYQSDAVLDTMQGELPSHCVRHEDVMANEMLSNEDRIRKLTDVVMFMEQCKMNA